MNHRIKPLTLLLSLGFAATQAMQEAQAQSIYQTIDRHGNVTFTDHPGHGGKQIHLPPLPLLPAMAPQQVAPAAVALQPVSGSGSGPESEPGQSPTRPGLPFMPYDTFSISTPVNSQTLPLGAAGNAQVLLNIQPALRKDHRVRLLLDGQISQSAMHTTTFILSNLNRGSHQLQAELIDASGTVRHRTPAQIIHVQRASINMLRNPNNRSNINNSGGLFNEPSN
ncbi:MAG: DUF4124 domain-containing protein [Halomonas sp.]|uniref:DUF4124 domain-containing protein n=1 Tax=Halomonas sp. TaxID=1486246 RepID=UPI003F8DDF9E